MSRHDESHPRRAHSKSEYKRLVALGDKTIMPPDPPQDGATPSDDPNMAGDGRLLLNAYLAGREAGSQTPDTAQLDELTRLRAENEKLRVPPPGWHRMAVVRATLPGEPLDPGYYVWVRTPGPAPEMVPAPLGFRRFKDGALVPSTLDDLLKQADAFMYGSDPRSFMIGHLADTIRSMSMAAPTPDPTAETPTPLVVDPPVDDPEYRAAWNAGYTEAIEDFKSQREAERPAEIPTPVDGAVEAMADGTADFSWMPPAETPSRKLSDDAFGLSETLVVTPKLRPAETQIPRQRDDCGGANECNHYEVYGVLCVRHGGLVDTPTGLAPLRTMSEDDLAPRYVGGIDPEQYIAVCVELDAQRQASASARREAIEECAAGARRTADEVDSRVEMAPKTVKELSTFGADTLREFAKSLDQLARVSPRPPSGGGQ